MKRKIMMMGIALSASVCCMTSCGEKKGSAETATTDSVEVSTSEAKVHSEQSLRNNYTAKLGGKTYDVLVHRVADASLPQVADEVGNKYTDNRVDVTVSCEGKLLMQRSFTKDCFSDFLTATERTGTILLGMAYDSERSNAQTLCLGAQIGQVGIEEGPAFIVEIPLQGKGSFSIVRDQAQDTTGDAGMGD